MVKMVKKNIIIIVKVDFMVSVITVKKKYVSSPSILKLMVYLIKDGDLASIKYR